MQTDKLFGFLRHRWPVLLIATLIGALLGFGVFQFRTPEYRSSATVYISTNQVAGETTNPYQANLTSQQMAKSYAELITNPAVTEKVANRMGPDISQEDVADSLSASIAPNSVLLEVSAVQEDAYQAQRMLEDALSVFQDLVRETSTQEVPETYTEEAKEVPTIQTSVIAAPTIAAAPVGPGKVAFIIAGTIVGLFIGLLIASALHLADRRLRDKEDLEALSTLPHLGSIPMDKSLNTRRALDFAQGYSHTTETFRTLRTNLQFCAIDDQPKVIQITSPLAGSGKSVVSINLATSLAELGASVCLVEADLRRPRLSEYLQVDAPLGATDVLLHNIPFADAVATLDGGVDVLLAGSIPPNPAEIIGSKALGKLIAELKEHYDFVIVDSTPVLPVTDAALLARVVDGTVVVVKWNSTTRENFTECIKSLEQVGAHLLGTVITHTRSSSRPGAYNHYYYAGKNSTTSQQVASPSEGSQVNDAQPEVEDAKVSDADSNEAQVPPGAREDEPENGK